MGCPPAHHRPRRHPGNPPHHARDRNPRHTPPKNSGPTRPERRPDPHPRAHRTYGRWADRPQPQPSLVRCTGQLWNRDPQHPSQCTRRPACGCASSTDPATSGASSSDRGSGTPGCSHNAPKGVVARTVGSSFQPRRPRERCTSVAHRTRLTAAPGGGTCHAGRRRCTCCAFTTGPHHRRGRSCELRARYAARGPQPRISGWTCSATCRTGTHPGAAESRTGGCRGGIAWWGRWQRREAPWK